MDARRKTVRRHAGGCSHAVWLAGLCILAISASPALAFWQDAGGSLGGVPQGKKKKADQTKPKSSLGSAKQEDPAEKKKEADRAKEDVIRSIDQILGNRSDGTPGAKKERVKPKPAARRTSPKPVKVAPPAVEKPEPPKEEEIILPPEERMYAFAIKDGTFEQLLDAWSRQTGLGVIGKPPSGKVTFVSDETLSFHDALKRIRTLLFKQEELAEQWLIYHKEDGFFEVKPVNEMRRYIDRDHRFASIEAFLASGVDPEELVYVVYRPKRAVADLQNVMDHMPLYVLIAPYAQSNTQTILALAKDVHKYLDLVDFLGGAKQDPRTIVRMKLDYIKPSVAIEKLHNLMDLDGSGGRAAKPRGRGSRAPKPSIVDIPEPPVSLLPDDATGVILVRAMQDKIDEIELLLPYIDVDSASSHPVVVVKVEHADVNTLVGTIQTILKSSSTQGGAGVGSGVKRKRTPKKSGKPGGASSAPVSADDITLIPLPAMSQIIVLADEAGVERVRDLVKQFDVETDVRHRFALLHAEPDEAIAQIMALANLGDAGVQLIADPRGDAIWYVGPAGMLSKVEQVLPDVDVAGEAIELYTFRPVNQPPSFLANMLREYQNSRASGRKSSKPTKPIKRKTSGRRAVTPVIAGRFTPDDEAGTLWVWCSQADWDEFLPLIEQLDSMAPEDPRITWLRPEHIDTREATDLLAQLAPMPNVVLFPTPDGILVTGASDAELAELKAIMAQVDRTDAKVQRTFTLLHADPQEMIELLQGVVGSSSGSKSRSPRRITPKKGKKAERMVMSSASDDLEIHTYGRQLIVRATESKMAEVERIIEQFDVKQIVTETRTYPFPPGTNLANVVGQLQGWLTVDRPKGTSAPVMIPRQGSRVLVVIAEPGQFSRIEELIDVIDDEPDTPQRITDYIAVQYVSAATLIEMIDPLLQISIHNLVAEGVLVEGGGAGPPELLNRKNRRRPKAGGEAESTSGLLTMMPDDRNHRIVIVAPQEIIVEARSLVADFDLEGSGPMYKRVSLRRAEAAAVVAAVKELMGQSTGRKGRPAARRGSDSGSDDESVSFTIVEAPGGGAVFVYGMPQDVESAERWIDELDSEASGKEIKLFEIQHADLKTLAEVIMTTVEVAQAKTPAGRARANRAATKDDSSDSSDSWETTFTRVGTDIYLKGDEIAGTLLAVATGAKMTQIEDIVLQFEGTDDEPPMIDSEPVLVPWMTYDLQHVSAALADLNLEMYLEALWQPSDRIPTVDYLFFGDTLVIKYPDESRFDEIRQIIAEKIDIVDEDDLLPKTITLNIPKGIDPSQAALWLQMHYPDVQIEVDEVQREVDWEDIVPRVRPAPVKRASNPCVLPMSYQRALDGLAMLAAVQDPAGEEPDDQPATKKEQPTRSDVPGAGLRGFINPARSSRSSQGEPKRKLKFVVDPVRGTVSVQGEARDVEEIEDLADKMKDELGNTEESARPDIRVYRVRYISVSEAAEIIDEVFNATRREAAQAQAAARAAARAAQQKANQQRRQQQQQQKGQPGQPQQPPRGGQQPPKVQVPQVSQQPGGVRIVPNPRDRTLIMKANTSDYPAILELLATIDQPQPINNAHRTFQLERLNAEEVTAQLKEMLGLDVRSRRTKSTGNNQGKGRSSSSRGGGRLPETIMQETVGGADELGLNPEDITLVANPAANTIFAMAPVAALDYIEQLIDAMDAHEAPKRDTKHFELAFADATSTAEYLTNYFNPAKKGQRNAPVSPFATPTFLPYPELNLVTVQAGSEQMTKVEELIAQVDVQGDSGQFESINVTTDAKTIAELLGRMYGAGGARGKRGGGDGHTPTFVGEEGGNILFYSAPAALHEEILKRIAEIEQQANVRTKPRIINLEFAKPSDIATAIEAAYGIKSGGRRGRSSGLFTITAHDPSKRLFVTKADDAMFAEIESLAKLLDKPADMGFEFRIYPFKHASARKAHELLTKLVTDYIRRIGRAGSIEPFSAEVDDKANALVVMGSPTVHEFIKKNIAIIDNPMNKESPPGFMIVSLKNAQATEVAQNINRLFGNAKTLPPGETPAQAEANRTLNTVMIRGSEEQLAKIRKEVIDPLEDYKPVELGTEIITLKFAQPEAVAESINKIFTDRQNALKRIPGSNVSPIENTVVVTPDVNTGQIIVQSSERNLELIRSRVAELDREDRAAGRATILKTYPIKYANPNTVASIITQWSRSRTMSRGRNLAQSARDVVIALAENDTQSVVVTASESNHKIIAELLLDLDNEKNATRQRKQHLIKLKHANAMEVAGRLTQLARSVRRKRGDAGAVFVGDPVSNTIIANVNEEELTQTQELLAAIDVKLDDSARRITKPYRLKYADPGSINAVILNLFRWDRGSQPSPSERVTSAVDAGTQSVVVTASESNHKIIEKLLADLDSEKNATHQRKQHLIKLKFANAEEMAGRLTQLARSVRRKRGDAGAVFVADPVSNTIIAQVNDEELTQTKKLLAAIDVEPDANAQRVTKPYPLKYAEPGSINAVIQNLFRWDRRSQPSPSERVTSAVDWGTRSVIVTASKKNHAVIAELVSQVDTESSFKKELHTYPLEHADAQQVAQSLAAVYRGRRASGRGEQPVQITADAASNQLVLMANDTEMEELDRLIKSLDVEPAESHGRAIKNFKLIYSEPFSVQNAINSMFRGMSRNPRDRVTAVPEWGSNSVIVSASPQKMKQVEELIDQFESGDTKQRGVRVVTVEHADPSSVAQSLSQVFVSRRRGFGGGEAPVTISAIQGSKSILIKAGEADMTRILDTLEKMDTDSFAVGGEIRVIPLLKSDASEVLTVMQEYLRKPGGGRGRGRRGGGGGDLAGDVRLSALTDGNAIVISGDKSEVDRIEAIIKSIDEEGEMGRTPRVIRLEHADAGQLLPSLEEMFANQQGNRGRRGPTQAPPVIVANETINAFIVRAGASDFNAIKELVRILDTEEAGAGTPLRIIPVKSGINVTDLASLLEDQFTETINVRSGGNNRRGGGRRESISIRADTRTHSIIVAGTSSLFNQVEETVRKMEEMGPTGQKHTAMIRPVNLTAEDVRDLIERLKDENQSSSGSSRSGRRGNSRGGSRRRR